MSAGYKLLAAAVLAAALVAGYAWWANHQQGIGYDKRTAEYTAAALEAASENRRIEQRRQSMVADITKVKDEKIRSINARLLDALDGLRDRPERSSAASVDPANCQGATGAGLSRPDAGFLEGEAARANTLRAGLEACYAQYESLTIK